MGRTAMAVQTGAKRQSPLKVDPAVDELISQGAHFLGITKKDLVAEAVKDYLAARREEIHRAMTEAMRVLDGTTKSRVALLADVAPEDIDRLGGIPD
jgi:hypothetical protein